MRRTSRYVAMTRDERNAADAVPAEAGISVFQQPAKVDFNIRVFMVRVIYKKLTAVVSGDGIKNNYSGVSP